MTYKPFNQQWFNTNDPQSRITVIAALHQVGFGFHNNPDQYGIDLISDWCRPFQDEIEIEHRTIWDGDIFPYETVHIPFRKAKFLGNDHAHYVVVNKDYTSIMICCGKELKHHLSEIKEVRNSAVSQDEYFYDVPRDCFKVINVNRI